MKNRRIIFTAAFIIIFCCSASAAFSVFNQPLQTATGGDASAVSFTLTIYQTFMALFGILSGKIVDKSGPKKLMMVGGIVFGAGWALTAFASSIPMLYLTTGIIAGAGNGLLYNPSLNVALKWFPEKKGTMSGILLGAASLGPLVLARVGAVLCDSFGTTGFLFIGIAYAVLVLAVAWIVEAPGADFRPDGWTPAQQSASAVRDVTPMEMIKTAKFWVMLILFSIACTAGIMMIGSLSSIAQTQLQMTAIVASNMVVVNCLSNLCGRLIIGRLCDKIGNAKTLEIVLFVTILALVGLRFVGTSVAGFVVCLIFLGAAFGGVLVVYPPLTASQFGMKNQGINYGIMFFGYAIGSLFGPQIAAQFVNKSAGTSAYYTVYIIAMAVAFVGALINLYLIKITSKKAEA
jgi:OFA family oxalate/formate antiporter-like MFS transporter